jgi:hypothetical protein
MQIEDNVEFEVTIAGRSCLARHYVGIGSLNVSTPRGEVKAVSGDYILTFGEGEKFVCGEELFLALAENGIDLDSFSEDDLVEKAPDPLASSSTSTPSPASSSSTSQSSGADMSFEILKARAGRGEILTDAEQARLLDGK